jgi:hypothetical protein
VDDVVGHEPGNRKVPVALITFARPPALGPWVPLRVEWFRLRDSLGIIPDIDHPACASTRLADRVLPKNLDKQTTGVIGRTGPGVALVHARGAALGHMSYGADPVAVLVLYGDHRAAVLAPQSVVNRSARGLFA